MLPNELIPEDLRDALADVLALLGDEVLPLDKFEQSLMKRLMQFGREIMRRRLEALSPSGAFVEDGVKWTVALHSRRDVMTSFGMVTAERPLFRDTRSGPTRCVMGERAGLVNGLWTPRAAKVASLAVAEMPMAQAEAFFAEVGTMTPSRSSMLRLVGALGDLWEADRANHEETVRNAQQIPQDAATVVVSLDGVMVTLVGSEKAAIKAAARANGRPDKGPAGFCEASVGIIAFYDGDGERLATRRYARMPEENKATTKDWLRAELTYIRKNRPSLTTMVIADGAANNWTFLETLGADVELVDFYHTAEHLHRHVSKAMGAATLDTQKTVRDMRHQLLKTKGSAAKIFADMKALREEAAARARTAAAHPDSANVDATAAGISSSDEARAPAPTKRKGKKTSHQPDYFARHHGRMDYPDARARHLPIGSGVTESTCKLAVCDRMRRTGMRWTERGGQAVMTLRAHRISGSFDIAWRALMAANVQRLLAA